jgi:hypothetical protein
MNAKARRGSSRRPDSRFHGASGEVEPLASAVAEGGQTNPMQHRLFIMVKIKDDRCGRAIEEIQSALPAFPTKREAADAMAGQTSQGSIFIWQWKDDQVYQLLTRPGQVAAQAEQTLTVLAESRQTDCGRTAVGPEKLITFVGNALFNMVAGRITTKKHS